MDVKNCSVQIEHMYQKIRPFYINTAGQGVYEINILEDSVTCYGDCDGSAALSTVGGVLPHMFGMSHLLIHLIIQV